MSMDKLLTNAVYGDWPMHYDPLFPEAYMHEDGTVEQYDTGMTVLDNGDVAFRVYAPEIDTVEIETAERRLTLTKGEDGIFTGTLPFDPLFVGPHSMDFLFNGTPLLYPYAPISWHRNRPVNYVDIPDPDTEYILVNHVPHGSVTREIFWSEAVKRWERCIVYTPPGYMNNQEEYPVLYLQHGMTENEITWEYNGRVSSIMDNLIAEKKIVPFIIVMNNGMLSLEGSKRPGSALGEMLIHDCIPYIEKTYRVKRDKWSRAMAGLSMGSMQTSVIGLTHPELFGYLGLFSGFLRDLTDEKGEGKHLQALNDIAGLAQNYKVFFRSIGDCDRLFFVFAEDDAICETKGLPTIPGYYRVIYKNQHHEFGAWRRALYDFAQLIFRSEGRSDG